MTEYIIIKCTKCGVRNKIEVGSNFECRHCRKWNVWKDEDFFKGEYQDTSPEDEEIKDEETLKDFGDVYDYKEEE